MIHIVQIRSGGDIPGGGLFISGLVENAAGRETDRPLGWRAA